MTVLRHHVWLFVVDLSFFHHTAATADTGTVYVKGAEVVGLYRTLLGAEGFKRGMRLYFERHDGQAVTCDDFRNAMAGQHCDWVIFVHWVYGVGFLRFFVWNVLV